MSHLVNCHLHGGFGRGRNFEQPGAKPRFPCARGPGSFFGRRSVRECLLNHYRFSVTKLHFRVRLGIVAPISSPESRLTSCQL